MRNCCLWKVTAAILIQHLRDIRQEHSWAISSLKISWVLILPLWQGTWQFPYLSQPLFSTELAGKHQTPPATHTYTLLHLITQHWWVGNTEPNSSPCWETCAQADAIQPESNVLVCNNHCFWWAVSILKLVQKSLMCTLFDLAGTGSTAQLRTWKTYQGYQLLQ